MSTSFTLNNGNKIPSIGFGTWKINKQEDVATSVYEALKIGYRHIDCAAAYCNEKFVGETLEKAFKELSIKREDVFITSKLWNTHHKAEHVRKACETTLANLRLKYLDLYLIHWPVAFEFTGVFDFKSVEELGKAGDDHRVLLAKVSLYETWREMEKLVEDGLVKNIGVCNFNACQLNDLLGYAKIKPVVDQIEYHPYYQTEDILDYCKRENILVTGYSSLGSGAQNAPVKDEAIIKIGEKYGKTAAQVILRWSLQKGMAIIPKSITPSRIKENFEIFDFQLDEKDMAAIDNLNKNEKIVNPFLAWGWRL